MTNAQIAVKFRRIRQLLRKQGEENKFRLMAYDKAANSIEAAPRELSEVLTEGEPAFHKFCSEIGSVGEQSRRKIVQLIQTGSCDELNYLEANQPAVQESFLDAIEDEMPAPKKRKASANLREEVTATRRPREQAQSVVDRVTEVCAKYFDKVEVCGSWRRGKVDIKDIDIALTGLKSDYGKDGVEMTFTRIERELGITEQNVVKRGIAQTAFYHPSEYGDWHVDFWYIPPESWGAAILFATGSADFNIGMRGWLKGQGFKLNRYGLYRVEGNVVVAQQTEEEIFEALGLRFVPPPDRIVFNAQTMRKAG